MLVYICNSDCALMVLLSSARSPLTRVGYDLYLVVIIEGQVATEKLDTAVNVPYCRLCKCERR